MTGEAKILKCRKCGNETSSENNYCSSCGARIYDIEKLMAPRKFSLKLAAYSGAFTAFSILLLTFLTAFIYVAANPAIINEPAKYLIITSIAGPVSGILIGTTVITYLVAEMHIKDTFYGASAVILLFKISDFIIASDFTIEGIGVALLSCGIAFAGAWLGFYIKKRIKFKY